MSPARKKFWLRACTQALFFFFKTLHLKCLTISEYACLYNCSVICAVTLCYPHIVTILPFSESWHLVLEAYSKPCETMTRQIQNPARLRTVYPSLIQLYSGIFRTLRNTCICRNLGDSESWDIQRTFITASRRKLRTLSYLRK